MTEQKSKKLRWTKLLAVALALSVSAGSVMAYGDDPQRAFDDANVRLRAAQYSIDRDKADLDAAQQRMAELSAAQDKARSELDSIRQQLNGQQNLPPTPADLDRARKDQAAQREQVQAAQKKFDATKANVDTIHAEALARFESTDAFKAAFATFDKARLELKVPTDAILDELAKTREFQDRVAEARAAKETERKLQDDKTADLKAIDAAHDAFVAADNRVQDLEEKALTADPKVMAARAEVDRARAVLVPMRDKFEDDLQTNAAFALALSEARRAETALNQAASDQKQIDDRVTQMAAAIDPAGNPQQPSRNELRSAQRAAERKLDAITFELDHAKVSASTAAVRLRDDQDGLAYALRDRDSAADAIRYQPAPGYPQPVVIDDPVYLPPPIVYVGPAFLPACPPPLSICYTPCSYDGYYSGVGFAFGYTSVRYSSGYYHQRWNGNGGYYGGGSDNWRDNSRYIREANDRTAYEARVNRRNVEATTAYESRVSRRVQAVNESQAAYEARVSRRNVEASSAVAADRAAYEQRVSRRAAEPAPQPVQVDAPRHQRGASSAPPPPPPADPPARSSRRSPEPAPPPPPRAPTRGSSQTPSDDSGGGARYGGANASSQGSRRSR